MQAQRPLGAAAAFQPRLAPTWSLHYPQSLLGVGRLSCPDGSPAGGQRPTQDPNERS
jgi:hypothetical protein